MSDLKRIKETTNEHGVPVAHYICDDCGEPFTLTPAPESDEEWGSCLAETCISYDPARAIHINEAGELVAGEEEVPS